jgi:hypothetical protein
MSAVVDWAPCRSYCSVSFSLAGCSSLLSSPFALLLILLLLLLLLGSSHHLMFAVAAVNNQLLVFAQTIKASSDNDVGEIHSYPTIQARTDNNP